MVGNQRATRPLPDRGVTSDRPGTDLRPTITRTGRPRHRAAQVRPGTSTASSVIISSTIRYERTDGSSSRSDTIT